MSNRTRRPTHPGEILREDILPSLEITQTQLAEFLGVSRQSVVELIQERRNVSPEMAHRLARLFKTTLEFWMNLQQARDLWDALQGGAKEYDRIKPLVAV